MFNYVTAKSRMCVEQIFVQTTRLNILNGNFIHLSDLYPSQGTYDHL